MRILFATTRGVGHLSPLLPFAAELSNRGHDIAIAARTELAGKISKAGYKHILLDGPEQKDMAVVWERARELSPDDALALFVSNLFCGVIARAALPNMQSVISEWQPDLVVRETLEFASLVAAESANVPCARVEVHNAQGEEGFVLNNAIPALESLRKDAGLESDDGLALNTEQVFSFFPEALDGSVVRRGKKTFRVGGSNNAVAPSNSKTNWAPRDGEPLIYMTFGTETANMESAKSIYRIALDAVAEMPVRVLLTTGAELDPEQLGHIPANATVLPFVQQTDVFPIATAMVCHGGSGTMLGGLAAGLPMVITPLFADQPSNALLFEKAGSGLSVVDPDPASLRAAIEKVLSDQTFSAKAKRIAKDMADMPSIEMAVDALLDQNGFA